MGRWRMRAAAVVLAWGTQVQGADRVLLDMVHHNPGEARYTSQFSVGVDGARGGRSGRGAVRYGPIRRGTERS